MFFSSLKGCPLVSLVGCPFVSLVGCPLVSLVGCPLAPYISISCQVVIFILYLLPLSFFSSFSTFYYCLVSCLWSGWEVSSWLIFLTVGDAFLFSTDRSSFSFFRFINIFIQSSSQPFPSTLPACSLSFDAFCSPRPICWFLCDRLLRLFLISSIFLQLLWSNSFLVRVGCSEGWGWMVLVLWFSFLKSSLDPLMMKLGDGWVWLASSFPCSLSMISSISRINLFLCVWQNYCRLFLLDWMRSLSTSCCSVEKGRSSARHSEWGSINARMLICGCWHTIRLSIGKQLLIWQWISTSIMRFKLVSNSPRKQFRPSLSGWACRFRDFMQPATVTAQYSQCRCKSCAFWMKRRGRTKQRLSMSFRILNFSLQSAIYCVLTFDNRMSRQGQSLLFLTNWLPFQSCWPVWLIPIIIKHQNSSARVSVFPPQSPHCLLSMHLANLIVKWTTYICP